jgi:hypothetical protein
MKIKEGQMTRKHMNVSDLDSEQLRTIVENIQKILWFNYATDKWDPDKEWKVDTIEFVAGVLEDEGLRPNRTLSE